MAISKTRALNIAKSRVNVYPFGRHQYCLSVYDANRRMSHDTNGYRWHQAKAAVTREVVRIAVKLHMPNAESIDVEMALDRIATGSARDRFGSVLALLTNAHKWQP